MLTYPPDIESYVEQAVANGTFKSREEFAVKAARLYRDLELRHAQLKADIQIAIDQADRGEVEPLDIEDIKRELAQRFNAKRQQK